MWSWAGCPEISTDCTRRGGRPSIAPERLLRALLLQVFYSVRSERLLMEQPNYNLLFRWFVGLEIDDAVWNHAVFSKNRDRLLNQDLAQKFFAHVKEQAAGLMSDEHFTVDGTLVEAWASLKSFKLRHQEPTQPPDDPGNPTVNFHGERRGNATHQSTTDPEAKLAKKGAGKEAKLCYSANALMENRNGLLIEFAVAPADGHAERKSARAMPETELPGGSVGSFVSVSHTMKPVRAGGKVWWRTRKAQSRTRCWINCWRGGIRRRSLRRAVWSTN